MMANPTSNAHVSRAITCHLMNDHVLISMNAMYTAIRLSLHAGTLVHCVSTPLETTRVYDYTLVH